MRKIIGFFGVVGFIALFLVIHFYPEIPSSTLGWVALFLLGIPAWLFIEFVGKIVLSSDFFKNHSSSVRILLGIPTIIL